MNQLDIFNEHRPLLFGIAYRMSGSHSDAEDLVQETFLRWQNAATSDIASPKAYLSTIITRLAIDHLRSARLQREQYVGPWLPEPVLTKDSIDPAKMPELAESLSMAFLVILESLSATERAAFLLHDVFDYEYSEIANIIGKSEASCRQIVHRARERIGDRKRRFDASVQSSQNVAQRFLEAAESGNIEKLMSMLAPDVRLVSDGGGKVAAARKPVIGAELVARLIDGLMTKFRPVDAGFSCTEANGEPAIITSSGGTIVSIVILAMEGNRVRNIFSVANPDKLKCIKKWGG